MAFRDWSFRERSGMAALRASCRLLSRIEGGVTGTHTGGDVDPSPMPGELLRSQWYTQRLVHMTTTGTLLPFPVVDKLPGTPISCGGGVRDCTLIDVRVNSSDLWGSDVHAVEICLGEGGGERTVRANLLKGFPYDQATGGNVYLRDQILAFHCNRLLPNQRGRPCYQGFGPCARCVREGYPIPTHPFPVWDSHQDTSDVIRPNVDLDVLYSTELVSPALHSRIQARVDELACRRQDSPMPLYHNIIDPNLTVDCEGSWFATEFDVAEQLSAAVPAQLVLDHACARATGRRLPFGLSHHIVADLADVGARRLHARMRTAIPGLDPHADHKLHLAVENLLTAALPMLSMLRKPALLLPGPLQVVVKAQRIVLEDGQEYAGLWHEDGMNEHVAAVVLYYHRASPTLQGGSLEFCSKQTLTLWKNEDAAGDLVQALPRGQVPIEEGTLVVFSNFESVHRVLPMVARHGSGSRDFLALFVIDQRRPLSSPPPLSALQPEEQRKHTRMQLLGRLLTAKRRFGVGNTQGVYSTGNGRPQDLGWVLRNLEADRGGVGGNGVGVVSEDDEEVDRLMNLPPPELGRGVSALLMQPPQPARALFNPASTWEEHWVGAEGLVVYVDRPHFSYGIRIPGEGVSEVKKFTDVAAFEAQGFWTEDTALEEQILRLLEGQNPAA